MGLGVFLRGVRELFAGERRRGVTRVRDRAYVEVRGIAQLDMPRFARALREHCEELAWVSRVEVNPFTRRVGLVIDGPDVADDDLVALVAEVEQGLRRREGLLAHDVERALPDEGGIELQLALETAADAAALVMALGLRVLPLFPRRLGSNLHALVFLTSLTPALRRRVDERLGSEQADLALHLATAATQALAQRPLAALVHLSADAANLLEMRERRALWERWREELTSSDFGGAILEPSLPRPCDLKKGPVETYAERIWMIAAGTAGLSLVTTRSPSRALAAGLAALPQPVRLGRELFASELGRMFARHGCLVLSSEALRRLDRIDCFVLPAGLVSRDHFSISEVFGLNGISREQALTQAEALFAPERPLRIQQMGAFSLGPPHLLPHVVDSELPEEHRERARRGSLVLALSRGAEVVAFVEVHISPQTGVAEILAAARRANMRVVLASDDMQATEGLHPDDVIPLSRGLVDGIRRLQIEGHGVLFVSRGASPGLAAADVGVGLHVPGTPAPWGAHLICPDTTQEIETVIDACAAARKVSEQSTRLGMGAAALGTLASAGGKTALSARRVMLVVNGATLTAMVNAARRTAAVERAAHPMRDPTPWHALEAEGVLARLGSGREGLSAPLPQTTGRARTRSSLVELGRAVRAELMNPLSPLLALGAGVSAMVGSKADAGIVAGVGGINALIGGVQRFRTERALSQLVSSAETRVHVRRAGKVAVIPANALSRGDVIELFQGDVVPADCRIIDSTSLEVDMSSLTGESLPVLKSSAPSFADAVADVTSMVYAGSSVAAGRATAVVVATGTDTVAERGAVATPDDARGGVEARLRELMRLTGPVAFAAGAALVTAGMLRGRRMDDLVSTGVGLAVAAVPEGLPVLATAAQLSAAERLSRKGALVKNPRAIEALGRVDTLCVDKTGTLTEGRLELWLVHDCQRAEPVHLAQDTRLDVLRAASWAAADDSGLSVDPMDTAIVRAARARGARTDAGGLKLAERAFESGRRFAAVIVEEPERTMLYAKGAPEALLARCSHVAFGDELRPVAQERARLLAELDRLGHSGLRVIGVAERRVSAAELSDGASAKALLQDPGGLVLRGFVAFRDPVRETAAAGVTGLARAGVRVIMITGDHASTAESVAREVLLLGDRGVLTGGQIASLNESQLEAAVQHTAVFARVTPAQKVRIVRALQRTGRVVGMVGDGSNDAPAMRIADVGIAVGANSTESARASADLVLADARIDAIVEAVVEGRAMWDAVRDAVSILVGGNLGEIAFTVAIGGLAGRPPLHPRQLLLVNFLTDIAPSMAIALRPPRVEDLAQLRTAGPEASLGAPLNREIVARAITTSFGASTAWMLGRVTGTSARARTIGLVGLVGSQLGQTLIAGGTSRSVVLTSVGSMAALGLIVQIPGLSHVFGCTPLGPIGWSTAIGASMLATGVSPLVDRTVNRAADFVATLRREPHEPPAMTLFPASPPTSVIELSPALRLLRN
jgi:cation-transporting ATPase I